MISITNLTTELAVAFKRRLVRYGLMTLSPRLIPGTTLLIIDMQDCAVDCWSPKSVILDPVCQLVDSSKAAGDAVIRVEEEHAGATVAAVMKKLIGYPRCARVGKTDYSGAQEVSDECMLRGFGTEVFKVGGLWACSCIFDNVEKLAQLYPTSLIEVYAKACGFNPLSHKLFEQLPSNVKIVWELPLPVNA
jgi:hypothetical protein